MTEQFTERGYPLPEPDHSAVEDVIRINKSINMIDDDIQNIYEAKSQFVLEDIIDLWRD